MKTQEIENARKLQAPISIGSFKNIPKTVSVVGQNMANMKRLKKLRKLKRLGLLAGLGFGAGLAKAALPDEGFYADYLEKRKEGKGRWKSVKEVIGEAADPVAIDPNLWMQKAAPWPRLTYGDVKGGKRSQPWRKLKPLRKVGPYGQI